MTSLDQAVRCLIQADVNIHLVKRLRDRVQARTSGEQPAGFDRRKIEEKVLFEELIQLLDPGVPAFVPHKGQVLLFVGLQGSGKTTSLAKVAAWYKRKGWKIAMVCADTFRAGALDQLAQNATKLGVPYFGSRTDTDPVVVAHEGVAKFFGKFDLILVDTSGRHCQEADLFAEMKEIEHAIQPDGVYFVLDGRAGQGVETQARAFGQAVKVGSIILTKLDPGARGGGALSAVAATHAPVAFIGTGEHFGDLEPFSARGYASRLLGKGDLPGLVERVKEIAPPCLAKKGEFSLRDMQAQLCAVAKLGPLSQVSASLPAGLPLLEPGQADAQLRKTMIILDSMNNHELDTPKLMSGGRMLRIARGSGTSVKDVEAVLTQYKTFCTLLGRVDKMAKTRRR